MKQDFEKKGFCIAKNILQAPEILYWQTWCDKHIQHTSIGDRSLLKHAEIITLASHLQQHEQLVPLFSSATNQLYPIQVTFFEKNQDKNWLVAYHQDLMIPVTDDIQSLSLVNSLTKFKKQGQWYVQAPLEILKQSIALRLHLDDCYQIHGALKVISESHSHGRIKPETIKDNALQHFEVICELNAGDVLVMSPLILHASSKAAIPNRRRVLHFLFAPIQFTNNTK